MTVVVFKEYVFSSGTNLLLSTDSSCPQFLTYKYSTLHVFLKKEKQARMGKTCSTHGENKKYDKSMTVKVY
jgi:hypothetical protein